MLFEHRYSNDFRILGIKWTDEEKGSSGVKCNIQNLRHKLPNELLQSDMFLRDIASRTQDDVVLPK